MKSKLTVENEEGEEKADEKMEGDGKYSTALATHSPSGCDG